MQSSQNLRSLQSHILGHQNEKSAPTTLPWSELGQGGLGRVAQRRSIVDLVAPTPGFLVYVESTKLSNQVNEIEPMVFSAIDANTHLQIARLYLTPSFASAKNRDASTSITERLLNRRSLCPILTSQIRKFSACSNVSKLRLILLCLSTRDRSPLKGFLEYLAGSWSDRSQITLGLPSRINRLG